MDEGAGSRSPKTLADVSHLFFSRVEDSAEEPPEAPARPAVAVTGVSPAAEDLQLTRILVVTGGDDAPGKSTIAVNLATALVPFGPVAVFDADPRVPNARYFAGLPSWHYLSPLVGESTAAPNITTDSGVIVADWSTEAANADNAPGAGGVIYTDVPESGRELLAFAVFDVPTSRTELMARLCTKASAFIVVARPGRSGFESAYGALKELKQQCGVGAAALVVNGAANDDYAAQFHAKMKAAAERLLSVDLHFAGAVPHEPGLGAAQRERGAIVASSSDGATALSLRRVASNTLELTSSGGPLGDGPISRDR